LQQAKEALEIKRHERREDSLPILGRKPIFGDYCYTYFEKTKVQRKRPGTVENERQAIARWRSDLGHLRIDKIATPMIAAFVDKRLKGGAFGGRKLEPVSERTANLDLMALRNVLKGARMPAVLLECGVIVNRAEEEQLNTVEYRNRLTKTIETAIQGFADSAATSAESN
jgi:hypothetical protein